MRVVSGQLRGRRLKAPGGNVARPVQGRVREAMFNSLGNLGGADVLDLCAGTGAVGIEALSRGAEHAVFVDNNREACRVIRANLGAEESRADVFPSDAVRAVNRLAAQGRTFHFVFVDAPYDIGLSQKAVQSVMDAGLLVNDGVLAVTVRAAETLPDGTGGCEMVFDRTYGGTRLAMYVRRSSETGPDESGDAERDDSDNK